MTNTLGLPAYAEHILRARDKVRGQWAQIHWGGPHLDRVFFNSIRRSSARDPRAEPDAGLFMYLSPHRVPDRNHPCQHRFTSAEFPCTETLVIITVYYGPCHDIVSYSSVSLLSDLQKSP